MNIPENTGPNKRARSAKRRTASYRRRVERIEVANRKEPPMSPLTQTRLLLPLLNVIRDHLAATEYAAFRRTTHGSPYIETRTERDIMIASVADDGLYAPDAGGSRYACDPNASRGAINNAVRRALNDARETWS